jgi:hypothetical protein
LGEVAELPGEKQHAAFARISRRYGERSREQPATAKTVPIAAGPKPPCRRSPHLAAG